ncbi:MAG: acyltransferase [Paracoccus sp.]|nr:acyltransferase [Paracoccus sp. (in: a-proteobacteria)]
MIEDLGNNNKIICPDGFTLTGRINGSNNILTVGKTLRKSSMRLVINGDNNILNVGDNTALTNIHIYIGNHVKANHTAVEIGNAVSTEPSCALYVFNSGNKIKIGNDCMVSSSVIIRCGESPHLIFDAITGEYLDLSEGVFIGNHVWIGEKAYITKNVTIPDECIVAACSVVTKRFEEPHSVLAGNPAKIAKRGVRWARNENTLTPGSREEASLQRHKKSASHPRGATSYQYIFLSETLQFHIDSPFGEIRGGQSEVFLKGWVRRDFGSHFTIGYRCHDNSFHQMPVVEREDVRRFFRSNHQIEVDSACGFAASLDLSLVSYLLVNFGSETHRIDIKKK